MTFLIFVTIVMTTTLLFAVFVTHGPKLYSAIDILALSQIGVKAYEVEFKYRYGKFLPGCSSKTQVYRTQNIISGEWISRSGNELDWDECKAIRLKKEAGDLFSETYAKVHKESDRP